MKEATTLSRLTNGRHAPATAEYEPRPAVSIEAARSAVERASDVFAAIRAEITAKRAEADELQAELDTLIASLAHGVVARKKSKAKANGVHVDPPADRPPLEPIEPTPRAITEDMCTVEKPKAAKTKYGDVVIDGPGPTEDELRRTCIADVISDLNEGIRSSLLGDCELHGIATVGDLVSRLTNMGEFASIDELCAVTSDAMIFASALKAFFSQAGFAWSNLNADGLPKSWLASSVDPTETVSADDILAMAMRGPKKPEPKSTSKKPRAAKPASGSYRPAALLEAIGADTGETIFVKGMADADLVATISAAFATPPAVGDDWSVDVSKKIGPRFWNSQKGVKSKQPATLHGLALLEAVRVVLGIGRPTEGGES
jgi:hypothetical protein